jgi:hypothetical protein|nr:MAG TPA: triphosphate pyrophosphohydrolase [Caudoviricetes sp.]
MSDSFEEIIEDAWLYPCDYSRRRGAGPADDVRCIGCMFVGPKSCGEKMRSDLVRRCKDVAASIGCKHGDGAGGSVNIGEVATFPDAKADKAQALKVLEEAAEVFGAWQVFDDYEPPSFFAEAVLDECADVIQATCNLVAAIGVTDLAPYMEECRMRNEERGRL